MSEFVEQVVWNNVRRSFARLWILDILSTEGEIRTTDDDDAALRRLALQMIIRLLLSTPKPVAAESIAVADVITQIIVKGNSSSNDDDDDDSRYGLYIILPVSKLSSCNHFVTWRVQQ